MQWAKRFFDINARAVEYNALERRKNAPTPWDGNAGAASTTSTRRSMPMTMQPRGVKKAATNPAAVRKPEQPKQTGGPSGPGASQSNAQSAAEIKKLNDKIAEMMIQNDILEKEKEFYFGKLRDIEIFCQCNDAENNPTVQEVQKILFATDEETVQVNVDGTVVISPVEGDAENAEETPA